MGLFKILVIVIFFLLLMVIAEPEPIRSIPLTGGVTSITTQVCSGPYTLANAETLALIAVRCNISTSEILALNPGLRDVRSVTPGTRIILPGAGTFPAGQNVVPVTGGERTTPAQTVQSVAGFADPTQTYTIQAGDTLSAIATRYNTSVASITALNPQISNPNLIYPGQSIRIP